MGHFQGLFTFAAATTGLEMHINSTGMEPSPPAFVTGVPIVLTVEQTAEQELYAKEKKLMWLTGEAVIKQAITTMISNSLFIKMQKEVTAHLM